MKWNINEIMNYIQWDNRLNYDVNFYYDANDTDQKWTVQLKVWIGGFLVTVLMTGWPDVQLQVL